MNRILAMWLTAALVGLGFGMIGCSDKGPAEKAGEKLDEAGEKAKEAVTPDGPAENAGEKVDSTVNDATH